VDLLVFNIDGARIGHRRSAYLESLDVLSDPPVSPTERMLSSTPMARRAC